MAKKLDPKVAALIHKDFDVTPARVREFSKAKFAVQLLVLTELRKRANSQTSSAELALMGLLVAVLALFVAPAKGIDFQALSPGAYIGTVIGIAVAGLLAISPVLIPHAIRQGQQERAHVWLAAYEDEIARRSAKGK